MVRVTRSDPPATTRWHRILYGVTGGLAALVIGVPLSGVIADAVDGPSATISGTVFEDRDNDDQVDSGEPVLPGVSVSGLPESGRNFLKVSSKDKHCGPLGGRHRGPR